MDLSGIFGTPFDGGQSMWSMPSGSAGLSTMQGTMTFAQMASTMMAGQAKADSYESAAAFQDLTMDREREASEERSAAIRSETLQIMGGQSVAFAASGVDASSGSAAKLVGQTAKKGKHALEIEGDNADFEMMKAGWRAASYRTSATNSLISAGMNASNQYANYQMDLAKRG